MRELRGYKEAQVMTGSKRLPAGNYVLKILKVKLEENPDPDKSDVLIFSFDILEGEHANYFKDNYDNQKNEDKKWKGTYRLYVPKEDGSEQDNWTLSRFKTTMVAFEESNEGFIWNWDEDKLNGLIIGGLFRDKEFMTSDGNKITFTQCGLFTDVESVRNGTAKPLNPILLPENTTVASGSGNDFVSANESELPF